MSTIGTHAIRPGHVPFRPELPDELESLQARITHSLRVIERCCREGELERCGEELAAFDRTLQQYLIDEGVQLEPYLRCTLEQELDTLRLMNGLRARLRELAREVHDVAQVASNGRGTRALRIVDDAVSRVGRELAECLERQRTLLFPHYRPLETEETD